jgi:MFS family permease
MPLVTRLPRTIPFHVAVALLFATSGVMWGVWIARIPGVSSSLDLDRAELGLVLPVFSIGALIAFPVSAAISSRYGSRVAIRIFGVLRGLLFPLLALAPNAVTLALALGLGGFAHGALDVALNAQGVEIERRMSGSILSRAHGSFSLGALVGSLSVGFAATAGLDLSLQFAIPGLLAAAIFATLTGQLLDDDVATPNPATERLGTKRRWRGVRVPPRALWALGAIALVTGIADEAIADWTTLFIRQDLGATPFVASLAYSIYSLAMLIGRFSGDSLSARLDAMRILQIAGTMGAVGLLIGTIVQTPLAMLVGIGIVGLGFSAIYPTLYRLAGNAPDISRASGLATIATIAYLGFMIGPLIIGPIASATSLRAALIGVGALCFLIPLLGRSPREAEHTVEEPVPEVDLDNLPEPNPYSL